MSDKIDKKKMASLRSNNLVSRGRVYIDPADLEDGKHYHLVRYSELDKGRYYNALGAGYTPVEKDINIGDKEFMNSAHMGSGSIKHLGREAGVGILMEISQERFDELQKVHQDEADDWDRQIGKLEKSRTQIDI